MHLHAVRPRCRRPPRDRSAIVVQALVAALCCSAGGCKDDPVGLGGPLTGASTADPMTSGPPQDDGVDDNDDGAEMPADSGVTTDVSTTASGQDGSSSSSSVGDSSTGCVPGTAGCACTGDEPPCEDPMASCVDDVCVAPLCPMDEELPINDLPGDAIDLGQFNDGGNGDTIVSQLSGSGDVDWWRYTCIDTLIPELDPARQINGSASLRVCKFPDCLTGGNPTQFSCPANATEEMIAFEFLRGCCVTDGSSFNVNYNCPDSDDDSVVVYLRVDQAQDEDVCVDYEIDFSC